jgi:two-component system, response regulator
VKTKNILLVENNNDDATLARLAFKRGSFSNNLIIVRDGAEALEYLFGTGGYQDRDSACVPDIILLDLKMPRLNGFEVLRRIRADERTRTVPVIILSSSLEPQDLRKGYDLGANSYIRKPLDFNEFIEVVKNLETYWFVINQMPPRELGGRVS